jgi:ArsR family transcriptional regulator
MSVDMSLPMYEAQRAATVAGLAKVLADPVRVRLLDALRAREGDVCQCELAPLFDISQPTLSHHLHKLEEAELIVVERRGRWAYYAIRDEPLEVLRSWLS